MIFNKFFNPKEQTMVRRAFFQKSTMEGRGGEDDLKDAVLSDSPGCETEWTYAEGSAGSLGRGGAENGSGREAEMVFEEGSAGNWGIGSADNGGRSETVLDGVGSENRPGFKAGVSYMDGPSGSRSKGVMVEVSNLDRVMKNTNSPCHPHAQNFLDVSSLCVSSGVSGCGFPSVGVAGSPGWARGRWSARLSSSLCCPGCGLFGDGTLCMVCDFGGVHNPARDNSDLNLRLERRPELRGGLKLTRVSSGVQFGSPLVDNASGDAGLADYLRRAPRSWPVEAWECRVVLSPFVEMVRFFFAGRCEVVSTVLLTREWCSESTGPGEPLRSWLGWTPLLHTPSSGVWLFRGAVRGSSFSLRLCPQWTGFLGALTALPGR